MRQIRPLIRQVLGTSVKTGRNDDPQAESRRILARVSRETDSGGFAAMASMARRVAKPSEANAPEGFDPIEYWGTKIGRVLGLLICAALLLWLALTVFRGV